MRILFLSLSVFFAFPIFAQTESEGKKALEKGLELLNTGQFDDAIASFTQAAELDQNMDVAYYFRAQAYIYKQEYTNAASDASKAIKMNSDNLDAYLMRAKANTSLQTIDGAELAIKDCDYVIAQNAEKADAYFDRSKAHMVLEDYTSAANDCSKAIEIDPERADFWYGRGMIYIAYENKPEIGCADLKQAATLGNDHANQLSQQMCD